METIHPEGNRLQLPGSWPFGPPPIQYHDYTLTWFEASLKASDISQQTCSPGHYGQSAVPHPSHPRDPSASQTQCVLSHQTKTLSLSPGRDLLSYSSKKPASVLAFPIPASWCCKLESSRCLSNLPSLFLSPHAQPLSTLETEGTPLSLPFSLPIMSPGSLLIVPKIRA